MVVKRALGGAVAVATVVGAKTVGAACALGISMALPKQIRFLRVLLLLVTRRGRQLACAAGAAEVPPGIAGLLDIICGGLPFCTFAPVLLSKLAPPVWRTLMFYKHMVPVFVAYFKCLKVK